MGHVYYPTAAPGVSLGAANTFTLGPQTITPGAAGNIGLIVKGFASQTANLQEWQNSGGTILARVNSAGVILGEQFDTVGATTTPFKAQGTNIIGRPGAGNGLEWANNAYWQVSKFYGNALELLQLNPTIADGETALLIRRDVGGAETVQRVSMGIADSGGSGYKLLRVPN